MERRGSVFQKQGTVEPRCRGACGQQVPGLIEEVFPEAGDVPAAGDRVGVGGMLGGVGA